MRASASKSRMTNERNKEENGGEASLAAHEESHDNASRGEKESREGSCIYKTVCAHRWRDNDRFVQ